MKYREYLEDKKYALMDFKGNYFYLKYLTINFEVYKKNLPIIIGDDEKEWRNISDKFATDVIQNNLRVYLNVIKRKEELFNKYNLTSYTQLPLITKDDPVCKYHGGKRNDIFKIINNSETSGIYISYRLVQ